MFDEQLPDDVESVYIGRLATSLAQLVTVRLVSAKDHTGGIGYSGTAKTYEEAYKQAVNRRERLQTLVLVEATDV